MSREKYQRQRHRGPLSGEMIAVLLTGGDIPIPSSCPSCGSPMEAYTATSAFAVPKPGDVSICFPCGALCIFTDDLGLRQATEEETAEIRANNPTVKTLMDSMQAKRKK